MKNSVNTFTNKKPYFIAEIGVNHENSLDLAEKIIKQAKAGGADAVKFQTYKASKIACKKSPYYWDLSKVKEKSQYELFKKFDHFNNNEYLKLKKICNHYKIDFLSTPFDTDAAKFLNPLMPFFKIASADITNIPLIDQICKFKKPIILSTGAADFAEIEFINNYIKKKNSKLKVCLMHCVLSYPTKNEDANLNLIKILKKKFPDRIIGYSDHTMPDKEMFILSQAFMIGAEIIEKHFTLDKFKGKLNNDHFHSIDFKDLIKFYKKVEFIKKLSGNLTNRKVLKCEVKSRKNARRSIVVNGNISKGEKFTKKNLTTKRPGTGINPINFQNILGKKAKRSLKDDYILKLSDIC